MSSFDWALQEVVLCNLYFGFLRFGIYADALSVWAYRVKILTSVQQKHDEHREDCDFWRPISSVVSVVSGQGPRFSCGTCSLTSYCFTPPRSVCRCDVTSRAYNSVIVDFNTILGSLRLHDVLLPEYSFRKQTWLLLPLEPETEIFWFQKQKSIP